MVTVAEASAFDLLEALDDVGGRTRFTRLRFGQMARQVSQGPSLTLRDEAGLLVAVVGLWPEADHLEAWLAIGPAFRRRMRGALDRIEAALVFLAAREAQVAGAVTVRIYVVQRDRVAGARLAAWLGFIKTGEEATPAGRLVVFSRSFGRTAA